jgi:GTP-binding protein Era
MTPFRSGFIAVVGRPNVGKSSLVNAIAGEKVSIISAKPQTTRGTIRAIWNRPDAQVVFLDTPGIQKPKNRLGEHMARKVEEALSGIDGIVLVAEAGGGPGPGDAAACERLKELKIPVILALNKVDRVRKPDLLPEIARFAALLPFRAIVPVSAKTGEGMDGLTAEVLGLLPEGPRYFEPDIATDSTEREIAAELVREKALGLLEQEVPHGIAVEVLTFRRREDSDLIDIEAEIVCERKSHKGIVIGKDGSMLGRIGAAARYEIERMTGSKVNLQLHVRVREDWRNDERALKDLGYRK